MQRGLLPAAIGPALRLRHIADGVGDHRADVVRRDLVLACLLLLGLELLRLLQREHVRQCFVGCGGVAVGEHGHVVGAGRIRRVRTTARDAHVGRADHALRGAGLRDVLGQPTLPHLARQHVADHIGGDRGHGRAAAIAQAHRFALGPRGLRVGEVAVGQAAGGELVLVWCGAAGDGPALQVGVARHADVKATRACGDAALRLRALEVVVDLLFGCAQ
ncbi:hypothetical protein FQZ97_689360 [compost metagenome]